jgi:hypothetical protein
LPHFLQTLPLPFDFFITLPSFLVRQFAVIRMLEMLLERHTVGYIHPVPSQQQGSV